MHLFDVADIVFRDMPKRRYLLVLKADEIGQREYTDYDTDETLVDEIPIYTVLDLEQGITYKMDTDLEMGTKVA